MISLDQLQRLKEDVGSQDFARVITLFLTETDTVMTRLSGAQHSADLVTHLHFLKGAALNLGLTQFGALCHQGEEMARAGDHPGVDVPGICESYRNSRAALLRYVQSGPEGIKSGFQPARHHG